MADCHEAYRVVSVSHLTGAGALGPPATHLLFSECTRIEGYNVLTGRLEMQFLGMQPQHNLSMSSIIGIILY